MFCITKGCQCTSELEQSSDSFGCVIPVLDAFEKIKKTSKKIIIYNIGFQGSYTFWKSVEFDFSNFQVWIIWEKDNRLWKICFKTIAPIQFEE